MSESKVSTFVLHTKDQRQHLVEKINNLHTQDKRQHLIVEIKELKEEAVDLITNYQTQIIQKTELIVKHAEDFSSSEDEEDDNYSTIHSIRRDKQKMSAIVEGLYELQTPTHPYCPGCNRSGGRHPSQTSHMGENGCLNK